MKAYIFRLDWSATDSDMLVVRAANRAAAEAYAKSRGARYVHFYGEVDRVCEI